jgi:hypothetical protein
MGKRNLPVPGNAPVLHAVLPVARPASAPPYEVSGELHSVQRTGEGPIHQCKQRESEKNNPSKENP